MAFQAMAASKRLSKESWKSHFYFCDFQKQTENSYDVPRWVLWVSDITSWVAVTVSEDQHGSFFPLFWHLNGSTDVKKIKHLLPLHAPLTAARASHQPRNIWHLQIPYWHSVWALIRYNSFPPAWHVAVTIISSSESHIKVHSLYTFGRAHLLCGMAQLHCSQLLTCGYLKL